MVEQACLGDFSRSVDTAIRDFDSISLARGLDHDMFICCKHPIRGLLLGTSKFVFCNAAEEKKLRQLKTEACNSRCRSETASIIDASLKAGSCPGSVIAQHMRVTL